MTTKIIDGMSNADYHRHSALGSTSLKTLALKTPAHWKHERDNPVHKDVFDLGTLAHSLILEDDTSLHQVIDVDDKRGNKWTIPANEAKASGLIPVTSKEWAGIVAMRDSVMAHPLASAAFTGHTAEQSIFWDHESGAALKTRPDALHTGGLLGNMIVDLKTAATADPNEFGRTAANFGYHIQQAHYQAGLKAAYGEDFGFLFVVVEKVALYLVSVVELHAEDVARGVDLAERGIRIYNQCKSSGVWPGYEAREPIELPRWARYQEEEMLDARV